MDHKEAKAILQRWPKESEEWQAVMSLISTLEIDARRETMNPSMTPDARAFTCGTLAGVTSVFEELVDMATPPKSTI